MANIKRIEGKTGVSFQITVTQGRDISGKQVRHYRTWKPEGKMTERQMQKAVERAAADFEREIEQGYQTDNRQTFSSYARYVSPSKEARASKSGRFRTTNICFPAAIRQSDICASATSDRST